MDDLLEGLEESLPDKVGRRENYGALAVDGALKIHTAKGKKSQHYHIRMVEKEDMHRTSTVYSLTGEPDRMWIDDMSGQTTPVAYIGSKFAALPALTPQPLIGHAEGVAAGSTCFGDRNPHTYVWTAAGLTQGVDEEQMWDCTRGDGGMGFELGNGRHEPRGHTSGPPAHMADTL